MHPIIKAFFGFKAQNILGVLNQISASTNICEIHIYIDSESLVNETWPGQNRVS